MPASMLRPKERDEKETRERMTERVRTTTQLSKREAEKMVDASVGRVLDTLDRKAGMSEAERNRKPKDPR